MGIKIDPHTLERAKERGTTDDEIKEVINTGALIPAKHQRYAKVKVFNFKQERLGKYYEQKRVEVIYSLEKGVVVTITVYAFYGKWEN